MQSKKPQNLIERPPVIAIMGHIDHGKSTLLDYIRKANTTAGEAGGITQHVAAYEVIHKRNGEDKRITFLDTPGHAAFKGIRIRGANVADIAILIVSAEEGVKPQTIEALQCIKEAGIPYIVGINKIDSPKADVERTKQSLAEHEIYVEGYGGDIPWVAISAKTGEGIPELLDMMLLVAELQELKGDSSVKADGAIIEANLDTKKGISATLIVKNGTLGKGQFVVSGESFAPVRMMEDFRGKRIESAAISSPVKLIGFSSLPQIGELWSTVDSKKEAEVLIAEARIAKQKKGAKTEAAVGPENLLTIPLIIKADVSGTLEAIEGELKKLKNERVSLKVIHSGIGTISEGDIKPAVGQDNILIIGFNTKIDPQAVSFAERVGVQIHTFDIIYKLVEWVEQIMTEKTPKIQVEEVSGKAKIQKIFSKNKDKQVVGGKVQEGTIGIGEDVKIIRREAEIGTGKIRELQQQKQKATEAKKDTEFGAMIESKIEIAPGDRIESFKLVTK